jgi:hypothetical protein
METLIYMAGFFDGEGYIGLLKRKRNETQTEYYIQISIGQNDGGTMDWIKENFGGNLYSVKRDGSYWWIASGKAAYTVLKRIEPYLKYKKPQAQLAIKFYEGKVGGVRMTEEEKLRREEIYLQLKQEKRIFKKSTYVSNVAATTTKRIAS